MFFLFFFEIKKIICTQQKMLILYASEIAAAIGLNKYKTKTETLLKVWKRQTKQYKHACEYMLAHHNLDVTADDSSIEIITEQDLTSNVQQLNQSQTETSADLYAAVEKFNEEVADKLNVLRSQKRNLRQCITDIDNQLTTISPDADTETLTTLKKQKTDHMTQLNTYETKAYILTKTASEITSQKMYHYGHQQEQKIVTAPASNISDSNDKFYKKQIDGDFFVGGRIDGFRDGKLIEIKNRKTKIYEKLPDYDIIQVQCYMFLLDLNECYVEQYLTDDDGETYKHETCVKRDRKLWTDFVVPNMCLFVETLREFMNNMDIVHKYFTTPENKRARGITGLFTKTRKRLHVASTVPNLHYCCSEVIKNNNNMQQQSLTTSQQPPPQLSVSEYIKQFRFFEDDSNNSNSIDESWYQVPNFSVDLIDLIPQSWQFLRKFLTSRLSNYVDNEYRKSLVFPSRNQIFNALELCGDVSNVKVVILGADPYIRLSQAHGLAFSIQRTCPASNFPPSLKNIFNEIKRDLGLDNFTAGHGCLESWARQGVLLLNPILTVREGQSNSHFKSGWKEFTAEIIKHINETLTNVVFLLWGRSAQAYAENIDQTKHLILQTSHPSPLSVNRGFLGCGHFSKCNAYLTEHTKTPIDWTI